MPVTICLTLLTAASLAAAWYAPLFGGAAAWPLVVVTLVFLAETRFELRRWTAGRMDGPAHWIRCGVVVLGCFAWTGWLLWQRTAEVPDVGEPFVALESPTETPVERERNLRLAKPAESASGLFNGLRSLEQTSWYDTMQMRWHEPGIERTDNPPSMDLPTTIFALGVPDEGRKEIARLIAKAFEGDWSTTLRKELVEGPRRIPALGSRDARGRAKHLDDAAKSYCLMAALSLAEGKTDAALDEYAMALKVLRHRVLFGGYANSIGAIEGNDLEDELLDAAEMMLRRYGHDSAFCRGLLAVLDRHAQETPTFPDLVKACYAMHDPRPAPSTQWHRFAGPLAVLFDSPIETIRDDRLQRAFCRGLLKAADEKTLFTKPWLLYEPFDHVWPARYLALGAPERSVDEWTRILSHQTLFEVPLFRTFRGLEELARTAVRRDEIRLACAAALYKHDHGHDLKSLAELAPEYFPTLPESRYSECPFVLRRSDGETWKLRRQGEELPIVRTIAPGTPVIEMPGLPTLKIAVPVIR